jgi:hypothetical protein
MVDISLSGRSRAQAFSFPWIFGARQDLAISLGGMSAGFALLMMHTLLHWNMIVVWFVWVVCLDTPHFFGTYYRTYLDSKEWRQRRGLLLGSLAVFLIGPTLLAVASALHAFGVQNFKLPWRLLGVGVSLWAYLHITRQHYGVLRLYNRKNCEIGSFRVRAGFLCPLRFSGAVLRRIAVQSSAIAWLRRPCAGHVTAAVDLLDGSRRQFASTDLGSLDIPGGGSRHGRAGRYGWRCFRPASGFAEKPSIFPN